jgi:hypothetical protein
MGPGMNKLHTWKKSIAANRNEIGLVVPILLSLVIFSILMRYQGWRSKPLANWDILVYYLGAQSMIDDGAIMDRGDLSSYGSYQPPGTVYLVLPSSILVKDVRLFSLLGDLFLNIAAIVFLYLIFRQAFDRWLALAACTVYGLSRLVFMGLWPVGHPAYILGALWFLMQWIQKRSGWWLSSALVILAFGLYADLAILPFVFIIPVLWLLFRPPVRPAPVLLAAAIGLMIWFPYLRFESSRGFSDLKSILFLNPVSQQGETKSQTPMYCYASLPGEQDTVHGTYIPFLGNDEGMDRVVFPEPGWGKYHRACVLLSNLDRNYDEGYFLSASPVINAALWFFFLVGMFVLLGMAIVHWEKKNPFLGKIRSIHPAIILGVGLVGTLILIGGLSPDFLASFSADGQLFQGTRLVVEQLRYYAPLLFSACLFGVYIGFRSPKRSLQDIVPLIMVWIPWLLLVVLAERTRPERFWWIWPLQAAIMVLAVYQIIGIFSTKAWPKIALTVALGVLVFPLSFYLPSLRGWIEHGHGGEDSAQFQLVDYLHDELEAEGTEKVFLGYDLLSTYYRDEPPVDTRMRAGSWFDLILKTRWGIQNLNQDPTGKDNRDTWRILESENPSLSAPSPWEGFSAVKVFGPYILFRAEKRIMSFAQGDFPGFTNLCQDIFFPGISLALYVLRE